jgi:hypothetical protein
MKRACHLASAEFDQCREAAQALGIVVRRTAVACGRSRTEHWMFEEDGLRLMDW